MSNDNWIFVKDTLRKLKEQIDRHDKAVDQLLIPPESPLREPFHYTIDYLLSACELLVGDGNNTICWYVFDNEFGENGLEGWVGEEEREIRSLEDLRWLIEGTKVKE